MVTGKQNVVLVVVDRILVVVVLDILEVGRKVVGDVHDDVHDDVHENVQLLQFPIHMLHLCLSLVFHLAELTNTFQRANE